MIVRNRPSKEDNFITNCPYKKDKSAGGVSLAAIAAYTHGARL
jgi:hypothetical protein